MCNELKTMGRMQIGRVFAVGSFPLGIIWERASSRFRRTARFLMMDWQTAFR